MKYRILFLALLAIVVISCNSSEASCDDSKHKTECSNDGNTADNHKVEAKMHNDVKASKGFEGHDCGNCAGAKKTECESGAKSTVDTDSTKTGDHEKEVTDCKGHDH